MPFFPDAPIPQSPYAFSSPIVIKKWNGGSITAKVGYVRKHPEKNIIRLEKQWAGTAGAIKTQEYNVRKGDWVEIKKVVEGLLPKIGESSTAVDIDDAIKKIGEETQILDAFAKYPDFLKKLPESIDILTLPSDQKKALGQFLSTGGEVANAVMSKLAKQPIEDIDQFSKLLDDLKLSTINSLVTHITSRKNFIDMFEKLVHDETSYERRGDKSVHGYLRANIWLIDRNYSVLHDDETLKKIIHTQWNKEIGE